MNRNHRLQNVKERIVMKRIAVYQRGHVTEEEKQAMTEFISSIPGASVVHTYWDHDGSDRAEYLAMLAAAREGDVDAIVSQSICRLAPSSAECLRVIRNLHEHGVRVWFSKERFWSTDLTGRIMMAIIQELAGTTPSFAVL